MLIARIIFLFLFLVPEITLAQAPGLPGIVIEDLPGGGQSYSLTLQILALMTLLTLLPAVLLMMTSFTRIIIVLSILRQALGTAQTPPNQVLVGLALFLSFFIMAPIFTQVNDDAIQPYLDETIKADVAIEKALMPIKSFMLKQTRHTDIELFVQLAGHEELKGSADVPLRFLLPAFVTSELKTAFQIGFLIFVPFMVIDLVVASVLMSMGMMMLSPMMISLPFKILLFVLIDGWSLILGTLAGSFYAA
jgi:flagellar biosynthetic protein FliP